MQTWADVQLVFDVLHSPWLQVVVAEPMWPELELFKVPLKLWALLSRRPAQLPQVSVAPPQLRLDAQLALRPPLLAEQVQE